MARLAFAVLLLAAQGPCFTEAACFKPVSPESHLELVKDTYSADHGKAVVRYTLDDYALANWAHTVNFPSDMKTTFYNRMNFGNVCEPQALYQYAIGHYPCTVRDSMRLIEGVMGRIEQQVGGNVIKFKKTTTAECDRIGTTGKGRCVRFKYAEGAGTSYHSGTGVITLGKYWNNIGRIYHELGHALGMAHEHQREDRDTYLKVLYASNEAHQEWRYNLGHAVTEPTWWANNNKKKPCEQYSTEFDYASVSLYWAVDKDADDDADGLQRKETPRYISQGKPQHDWTHNKWNKGFSDDDKYAMRMRLDEIGVSGAAALAQDANPVAHAAELARFCPAGYHVTKDYVPGGFALSGPYRREPYTVKSAFPELSGGLRVSAAECANECSVDAKCRAFEYRLKGQYGYCFLNKQPAPNVVGSPAGWRFCTKIAWAVATRHIPSTGHHAGDAMRGSVDNCKNTCSRRDDCAGFTELDGICYFYKSAGPLVVHAAANWYSSPTHKIWSVTTRQIPSTGHHAGDAMRGSVESCKHTCVHRNDCAGFTELDGICYFYKSAGPLVAHAAANWYAAK